MIKELKINKGRVRAVEFERGQIAWKCTIWFTVTTSRQFTDEEFRVASGGRWWWVAYWRASRLYKITARSDRAKPGERAAKGWN